MGRTLTTRQLRKTGQTHRSAPTDAVRYIQRFGGALYLNVHIPMLLPDGVYTGGHDAHGHPRFQWVKTAGRAAPPRTTIFGLACGRESRRETPAGAVTPDSFTTAVLPVAGRGYSSRGF